MKRILKRTREHTLHLALDIVAAEFLNATGGLVTKATVLDLITWSGKRVMEQRDKIKQARLNKP